MSLIQLVAKNGGDYGPPRPTKAERRKAKLMRGDPPKRGRLFYRLGDTYYCSTDDIKTQVSKMADHFPIFGDRGALRIALQSAKTEYWTHLLHIIIPYCRNEFQSCQMTLTYQVSTLRVRSNAAAFTIKHTTPHLLKNNMVQLTQTILTPSDVDEANLLSLINGT